MIQRSWDLVLDTLAELADEVVSDVSTLHKIPKYFKTIVEFVGVQKADTKPVETDDMLNLVKELRKELQLISGIEAAHEMAMQEISRLGALAD